MDQQATLSLALAGGSAAPGLDIDLRRADIEAALGSGDEGPIELVLELEAREVDGGATRRHTLAVGCMPADLERILQDPGESVRLSFDAEALEHAIRTPELEAHGLREKMAVVAVVVATTGAAAGGTQAMPTMGGQGRHRRIRDVNPRHAGRLDQRVRRIHRGCAGDPGEPQCCRGSGGGSRLAELRPARAVLRWRAVPGTADGDARS